MTRPRGPSGTRAPIGRAIGLAAALLVTLGCGGRLVAADRGTHGNLHAELSRGAARWVARDSAPTVLLIERGGVRAIDPDRGVMRWYLPVHTVGHPVASGDSVYLPLRGHRLAAVDRATGAMRWSTRLPGEALTGLTVADGVVVAVVVDGSAKSRSRVVALSTDDAVVRWQRRSHARFGVPAARRSVVVVPMNNDVVAFRLSSGREVARVTLVAADGSGDAGMPELERMQTQRDALVLGGGNRFVNLLSATAGQVPQPQRIDTGFGWIFRPIEGLDPGHDDAERLRLWVRFVVSGEAPRAAVMLARRAVIALRLAPDGRPIRARWVHHADDEREYVAMDVGATRITLVREDGSIVRLDARSGVVTKRWAGERPTRGALLIALSDEGVAPEGSVPSEDATRRALAALFRDGDPRLLPAQILAADLLWRTHDVQARAWVEDLASGTRAAGSGDSAAQLQAHALTLLSRPWGAGDAAEIGDRLALLSDRPSFLADRSLRLAPVARAAVQSGSAEMVPHLVEHLLHPATVASDLVEIARALATLGGPTARAGLTEFVRRYHADPEIVYESRALHVAVDHLAGHADEDAAPEAGPEGGRPQGGAQSTLVAVLRDPFTEPELRAYIAARLGADVLALAAVAPVPDVAPRLPPIPQREADGRVPIPAYSE